LGGGVVSDLSATVISDRVVPGVSVSESSKSMGEGRWFIH
jgi:hypothetical protein